MRPPPRSTPASSRPHAPSTDAALAELRTRVAQLEALVLPLDDCAFLATLADATQGRIFSVRELRQHGAVDPALGQALARFSAKQLGKTLHRIADGRPRGPWRLARVGFEHGRALWQVGRAE